MVPVARHGVNVAGLRHWATAAVDADGGVDAWETQAGLPLATANLFNFPLLALDAAGIAQTPGRSTGLIDQSGGPPYTLPKVHAVAHWIPDAPLRTSAIGAPGEGGVRARRDWRWMRIHRNTALSAPRALSAGGNPVAGAVWMIASTTSVCDKPRFSADWPNFATCSGKRNAVKAATATSARWRRSRPGRNQISP